MKILVVQIGKIGDMVLTTPLFRAIHLYLPGAQIHVLASRRGAPVAQGNPHLRKILVYHKDPARLLVLLAKMRCTRYDFLIDPKDHFSAESAVLARMIRANIKIGFNKPGQSVFSRPLPAREENFTLHAAARNLLPLKLLGMADISDIKPELFPDARLQAKIRERYALDDARTVLLNISTGGACRLWEEGKWSAVARFCLSKGLRVLLSFKPEDSAAARNIHGHQPEAHVFHSPSIRDMVALIPLVDLVVSPDTSIVHIASAFNVPQVALFPPVEWNLNKFRPLSDSSIVLQPKKEESIAAIPAEVVIEAINKMLAKKR